MANFGKGGVRIEGLDVLKKKLEEMPIKAQKAVDNELSAGALLIAKDAKSRVPVYEGRLKQSIVAITNKPNYKEVVTNLYYAPYIEFGTGKKVQIPAGLQAIAASFRGRAKRGDFDDMVKALAEWVRKLGLAGTYSVKTQKRTGKKANRANEDMQVAMAIARAILKNGIRPHPFFFAAFDANKEKIKENVKRAVGE